MNASNSYPGDKSLVDKGKYQTLTSSLLYLTMNRVDISFEIQVLSQFMYTSKESHVEATLMVVRYIKTIPRLGLMIISQSSEFLTSCCDSNWGTYTQTRRSIIGYLVNFEITSVVEV